MCSDTPKPIELLASHFEAFRPRDEVLSVTTGWRG